VRQLNERPRKTCRQGRTVARWQNVEKLVHWQRISRVPECQLNGSTPHKLHARSKLEVELIQPNPDRHAELILRRY
jgi:hypothetical protein